MGDRSIEEQLADLQKQIDMMTKRAEIAEQRAIEAKRKLRAVERNEKLLLEGLPPLARFRGSVSPVKEGYENHPPLGRPAQLHLATFPLMEKLRWENFDDCDSTIWKRVHGDTLGQWNHESNIQHYCLHVLTDVVKLLRLDTDITVSIDLTLDLFSTCPTDVVVLKNKSNGELIGVCVIEIPTNVRSALITTTLEPTEDLHREYLINQVCNYLRVMKAYHGILQPIGIVSTYEEWSICWLEDSTNIINTTDFSSVKEADVFTSTRFASNFEPLCMSKIYQRNDPH
jgi:hypothetical protein